MEKLDHLVKKVFQDNLEAKALLVIQAMPVVMETRGSLVIQEPVEQRGLLARMEDR